MRRALVTLLFLLLLSVRLSAQTSVDAGVALGQQPYHGTLDDPRVLTSVEVLAQRGARGAHLSAEYADLDAVGALIVAHADVTYRWRGGGRLFVLAGAGPTLVSGLPGGPKATGNAEVELGYRWSRTEVFGRVREFTFSASQSSQGKAGPRGPAVYLGVRFALRDVSSR